MSIFILGIGYTGGVFASRMRAAGHAVGGTARDPARVAALRQDGIAALAFDVAGEIALPTSVFEDMEGLLVSIPPGREGDPLPGRLAPLIAAAARLRWIGYLSTVGVYGDHGGAWIDETTLARPLSARSRARLVAPRRGASHREARPGLQPRACRGHCERARTFPREGLHERDLQPHR